MEDAIAALRGRYVVDAKLGRGSFATVYRATEVDTGKTVAIKVVDKMFLDEEAARLLENELESLECVSQHPGVVTFYESVETERVVCFVLEYVAGGPLLDKIVERGSFSENDARIVLRSVLRTLSFMARLGVVHRDIKPENMLVDHTSDEWPVKLTDFGLSAKLHKNKPLYSVCGTPVFLAPEVIKGQGYDCACDMWSFGITLYTILCGYPPFFDEEVSPLISKIVEADLTFPSREWDRVSDGAKDIVRKMLAADPEERIRPDDALAHPWFSGQQSTNALPNSSLRSFNAKRKMRWAVNCVRTTFNFWGVLRTENSVSGSKSSEYFLEEVQRNAATIAELDRVSSNNTSEISPSVKSSDVPDDRSETSSIFHGGDANAGLSEQCSDGFSAVWDKSPFEASPVQSDLNEESGHDRELDATESKPSFSPLYRQSLLLPTMHPSRRADRIPSISSAIAGISFRAKAMIAEMDSYCSDRCTTLPDQSPFRPVVSVERSLDSSKLVSDSRQGCWSKRPQPPLSLEPLNLEDL